MIIMMMRLMIITLFWWQIKSTSHQHLPGLYGLGCATVDHYLYAMGGAIQERESAINRKIYRLDMSKLDIPNWETLTTTIPYEALYPLVIQPKGTSNLTLLGGKRSSIENSFYSLDLHKLTWSSIKTSSTVNLLESNDNIKAYPYGGGFVQSDLYPNEYYLWGGFIPNSDYSNQEYFDLLWVYSDGTWTSHKTNSGPNRYFGTTTVYQGAMYVVGGMSSRGDKIVPLKSVYKLDFQSKTWSEIICTGAEVGNRSHHSSTLIGNLLYVVGGNNVSPVSDRVEVLNLDTMNWITEPVKGLRSRGQGCLNHYQDRLVYSFGFSDPFIAQTQVIHLPTWNLMESQDDLPLSLILGVSIGGSLGGLLLLGLLLFLYQRHKRIQHVNRAYQKQYLAQMKAYNELNQSHQVIPPPLDDLMIASSTHDLHPSHHNSSLYFPTSTLTELNHDRVAESLAYNVEMPQEWFNTSTPNTPNSPHSPHPAHPKPSK